MLAVIANVSKAFGLTKIFAKVIETFTRFSYSIVPSTCYT